MGGCCGKERTERPETKIVPYEQRSCTDIIFLILFLASFAAVVGIVIRADKDGADPDRLFRGTDYKGRICGKDDGVQDAEWTMWPLPTVFSFRYCVQNCNQTEDPDLTVTEYTSKEFVHYCIPKPNGTIKVNVTLSGDFQDASEQASRAVGDIVTAWKVILGSLFVALVGSYVYVFLSRYVASFVVWLGILLTIAGGFFIGYACLERAKKYEDDPETENRAKALRYVGIGFIVATVIFLFVVYAMRNRIRIAIGVVKEAAQALGDMKLLICFPVFPFVAGVAYFIVWVVVAVWIFSVGTFDDRKISDADEALTTNPDFPWISEASGAPEDVTYKVFNWNDDYKKVFAYMFFHLLWVVQFLIYFAYTVSAGAVAAWYFTEWDDKGNKRRGDGDRELTHSPIRASCCRTLRFHMGSVALGSLIIAIVQFIRACVKYIEEKGKQLQGGHENCATKCVFCCIHCLLWCMECCLDKISKHSFIWMSIFGDDFGTACCSSVALLWRNLARVAAVTLVGSYLMFLGKVVVALCTTGLCAMVFARTEYYQENLSSIVLPCIVIFVLAYMVASLFMVTFETTIDTTFFCFLIDEEFNKDGKMFASEELRAVVERHSMESARQADIHKSFRSGMFIQNKGDPNAPAAATPGQATPTPTENPAVPQYH